MSRHWIALFAACALVFGNIGAGAQAVAASQTQSPTSAVAKNEPPLKPAGAAGISEAQGSDRGVLIVSGLILAGIVAALLLVDTGDDGTVTTTGSN